MDISTLDQLKLFAAAHIGALIYNTGWVRRTLGDHDRRITSNETATSELEKDVAGLKATSTAPKGKGLFS